ncbi:nuclear transport factor 2 family protein [Arsukibacterium sp.]|uniref:nuclear transport factor 2 family protein n=1 Tax=Arsukibacterium sp. TaxID=1977258 RepID=UPI002FD935D0
MTEQMDSRLAAFLAFYNQLSHQGLHGLTALYHAEVEFIDPVHQIQGCRQLQEYFEHAYQRLTSCQFTLVSHSASADCGFISWQMTLQHPAINKGRTITVPGCTELRWHQGLIRYHRDYYDLTDLVYQHLPVLGFVTTKIKHRMAKA